MEGGQVAVVDPDQLDAIEGQNPLQFRRIVHLNQDRQPEALGHLEQIGHVLIAQDRRNQQGRIGPGRPRLIELIGRQDEVLAQQRQVHDLTHLHQHLKAPLEERLVGQHR